MSRRRDPVEEAAAGSLDLYDIATWEPRSALDAVSVGIYRAVSLTTRLFVALLASVILFSQVALIALATARQPFVGVFILLSVVPALGLAAYIWRADATLREPLWLLVVTFLLGILFASFAAVLNSVAQQFFAAVPVVGLALFFYLVVGPVEETVKLLAVRLGAYNSRRFDAVIDGAVYGAMAGLGFATIENALYISNQYLNAPQEGLQLIGVTAGTAAFRTFAGPGHVIYSAFAGYYLGLAKFNPTNRGPIIVKGLLVAAFIHGTYNTLVTYLPAVVQFFPESGVEFPVAFIAFVVLFQGFFGYLLYRKISRYRAAYDEAQGRRTASVESELADE